MYLTASRGGVISSLVAARRSGDAGARTLIVGAGTVGRLLAKRFVEHPEIGLAPIAFLDKEPLDRNDVDEESPNLPVLGASWDLVDVLERERIEQVVFTFSTAPPLPTMGALIHHGRRARRCPSSAPRNIVSSMMGAPMQARMKTCSA